MPIGFSYKYFLLIFIQLLPTASSNEKVTPELQRKMIQLSELIDIFSQNMIL